jgi:2-methylisocitrate lyase-like PEP mutase family enzyme
MVANMIEGGKTPVLPRDQLAAMGFQLILYPLAGLFAAAKAIRTVYEQVYRDGTADRASQMTFAEFNELIGVAEKYALAERFGAS